MSVAIQLDLLISGPGEFEDRMRGTVTWLQANLRETDPEYHELIANLAMVKARQHWREADRMRGYQQDRAARLAKRQARQDAKGATPE
jgi:hypothetical protein